MVKLVHFADVHLGAQSYGRWDPETGLSVRLMDFLAAFDRIVERALTGDVDLVVFAGDAYRTRDPTPTHEREFAARIRRLAETGIQVVLITGNHDVPNAFGRANTLEIFDTLRVLNVHVVSRVQMLTIPTNSGPVQIVALPWIVRSDLLARDDYKGLSIEEIDRLMVEKVVSVVARVIDQLDPVLPHILVSHSTVQGAVYGSERSVMLGQEMALPLDLVAHPAFDYVALGHLHRHQVLNDHPPVVYSGSIERIDFGEEQEQKGFILAEVQRGGAEWEFVPLATRPFVTIETSVVRPDPTAQVVSAIGDHDIQGAVVRLIVHATAECDLLLRRNDISQALASAFHVASTVYDVERTVRARLGVSSVAMAGLGPAELLQRYFEVKGVAAERQKLLMEHAQAILTEVEENQ